MTAVAILLSVLGYFFMGLLLSPVNVWWWYHITNNEYLPGYAAFQACRTKYNSNGPWVLYGFGVPLWPLMALVVIVVLFVRSIIPTLTLIPKSASAIVNYLERPK